jgi:hypothetical protein
MWRSNFVQRINSRLPMAIMAMGDPGASERHLLSLIPYPRWGVRSG